MACSLGLEPGDSLISINGLPIRDLIDYRFRSAEPSLLLEVEQEGKRRQLRLTKGPDDDLGIGFEAVAFDGVRRCHNRCFFCFVDGLPQGLRPSLYLKDDDYRLSFLFGNYLTLTNLSEDDWKRLGEQRLSPLYVSVHTTDPDLRRQMLGNPLASGILEQLRRLGEQGIKVHAQVVLCPGVNDGHYLDETISHLATLYPTISSIAVVPVGVTRYNMGRWVPGGRRLKPMSGEEAKAVLAQLRPWQRDCRRRLGVSLVYAADELYLLAGEPFPSARAYDGFPQYHNGVGMVRSLVDGWRRIRWQGVTLPRRLRLTLVCGTLIAPMLRGLVEELNRLDDLMTDLVPVSNHLFGETVTVSGLLAGGDVIEQLRGNCHGDVLVLPRAMLDSGGERTLDDLTPTQIEQELGCEITFADSAGEVLRLIRRCAAS